MPTELRRLVFSNSQLRAALDNYKRVAPEIAPRGRIVSVSLMHDRPDPKVSVSYRDDSAGSDGDAALELEPKSVAAALVLYCMEFDVPVPRNARKKLTMMGDNICLEIVLRDAEEIDIGEIDPDALRIRNSP